MTEALQVNEKTKITSERVEIILNNLELPSETLSELTDGLSAEVEELVKDVERKVLIETQYHDHT